MNTPDPQKPIIPRFPPPVQFRSPDDFTLPPIEPRGWFRWLYDRYLQRNEIPMSDSFLRVELQGLRLWELEERFDEFSEKDPVWLAKVSGYHSWAVGLLRLPKVSAVSWPLWTPADRGRFLAGKSELCYDLEKPSWPANFSQLLEESTLCPVSACQLACNAIRCGQTEIIEKVLSCPVNWTSHIQRGDENAYPLSRFSEFVDQLSNRAIDLILEAAILFRDLNAIKLALAKGADPNIPIWALERSYNEKYCAITYFLGIPSLELIRVFLQSGANPRGNGFSAVNLPLYLALAHGHYDLAEELIDGGASLRKIDDHPQDKATSEHSVWRAFLTGNREADVQWIKRIIGAIVPLVDIEDKTQFYWGPGQGGQWEDPEKGMVYDDDLEDLKARESKGWDTRLSAEDIYWAIRANGLNTLKYLIGKTGEKNVHRVLSVIRKRTELFTSFYKTAKQGNLDALCYVGLAYATGIGVVKDLDEALRCFRSGAEQGHPTAQCILGVCYQEGHGVPRDLREAARWYRLAAEQDHGYAQFRLGYCYMEGYGVEKNPEQGKHWLEKPALPDLENPNEKYLAKRIQCRGYGCWQNLVPLPVDRRAPGSDLVCLTCGRRDWSNPCRT